MPADTVTEMERDLRLQIEEIEDKLDRPIRIDSPNARDYRNGLRRILDDLYRKLAEVKA